MSENILTQARIQELLHYAPDSGVFTRRKQVGGRFAGTTAGYLRATGYICINVDGFSYLAHRLAWIYITGEWPIEIDHIDRDRSNNAFDNIRSVEHKENSKNMPMRKDNKSGITGVVFSKRDNLWISAISVNGRLNTVYCGKDFFEACCQRRSAEIEHGYHPSHGRK